MERTAPTASDVPTGPRLDRRGLLTPTDMGRVNEFVFEAAAALQEDGRACTAAIDILSGRVVIFIAKHDTPLHALGPVPARYAGLIGEPFSSPQEGLARSYYGQPHVRFPILTDG